MTDETIFFSYSRVDSDFVLKLAKDLRDGGANVWLDQLDIKAGSHWDSSIEAALASASRLIVVLSTASVASNNVMDEVSYALESGKTVIPVLLNECTPPFRLRRLQRIDFTGDYETALNQLLVTIGEQPRGGQPARSPAGASVGAASIPDLPAFTADQKAEDANWQTASRTNTVGSYRAYLNKSPNGTHRAEAERAIRELEAAQKGRELEKLLWDKARKQDTRDAYEHYLAEYPQGTYVAQAEAALKGLHGHPQNNTDTATPKKKNLALLVLGGGIAIAVLALAVFGLSGPSEAELTAERKTAFAEAMVANDSATWSAFILAHPGTPEADSARVRLDSITETLADLRADSTQQADLAAEALDEYESTAAAAVDTTALHELRRVPEEVNGRNVAIVYYAMGAGRVGTVTQQDDGQWLEENHTGTFPFREKERDAWSVYLRDDARSFTMQIDLFRNKVSITNDHDGAKHDFYDITSAQAH